MSSKAIAEARKIIRSKLIKTNSMKLVLLCLAEHISHKDLNCYPSISRIENEMDLTRNTVTTAIKQLSQLGLITKKARKLRGGGHGSNVYYWQVGQFLPQLGQKDAIGSSNNTKQVGQELTPNQEQEEKDKGAFKLRNTTMGVMFKLEHSVLTSVCNALEEASKTQLDYFETSLEYQQDAIEDLNLWCHRMASRAQSGKLSAPRTRKTSE